jgi:salicylate hydroxylase
MKEAKAAVPGLNIVVVGAGIAGLAAARGLREAHRVTVVEQSRFKNEIGAAIHLAPNVTRILREWGVDLDVLKPVTARRIQERDYNNEVVSEVVMDSEKIFGSPWWWVHRVDLHSACRKLATDPDGPGKPTDIILGKAVVSCDPENGTVVLNDGTTLEADVIIGILQNCI